jgi:hypothetical protein
MLPPPYGDSRTAAPQNEALSPAIPESETDKALEELNNRAMDGFEEWLKAFKEELTGEA